MKRVIGVVGPIASGKGVVISFLQKQGYEVLSLSDVVRERAKEWGLEMTRKNLQDVGDKLRKQFGNSILAEMVAPQIAKNLPGLPAGRERKFVIDAIRNPAEVAFLTKEFGAYIIGVTASARDRFERMKQRANSYDPTTWEEFEKVEARDRGIGQQSHGQQVEKCLEMADITIKNTGNLEELHRKIASIFK